MLLQILELIVGIAALVCLVMVWIQMFQHQQTGLAIACIVLTFCLIGALITFIIGWMRAAEWRIQNIMYVWTACVVINLILGFIAPNPLAGLAGH